MNNLAILLDVSLRQLQRTMINAGFDEYPADYVLNSEVASLLVMEYNMIPIVSKQDSSDLIPRPEPENWSEYPPRPPVLVVMGHVDHGIVAALNLIFRKNNFARFIEKNICCRWRGRRYYSTYRRLFCNASTSFEQINNLS